MKTDTLCYIAAALLLVALVVSPPGTEAAGGDFGVWFSDADSCAGIGVRADGAVARSSESFTLTKSEAPALSIDGGKRANIHVRGWNRSDYSVEVCRIAAAADRGTADRLLKAIDVTRAGASFSAAGPSAEGERWMVAFIVNAPSGASLELKTTNGPIDAHGVNGSFRATSSNGPISLTGLSGKVEARATNGPVSFSGSDGDVRLSSTNGPISLNVDRARWNGALEASTANGPVTLKAPAGFESGVRVETGSHAPVSCRLQACQGARTETQEGKQVLQFNGDKPVIRVSTGKGPVSLTSGEGKGRVI